jgi:hypothetical protein
MDEEIQRGPFQYSLRASSPPPPGYPAGPEPDCFATDPKQSPGDWEERRRAYLDWVSRNPAQEHLSSVFRELARLEAGGPAHLALFEAALDFVDRRLDCADFVLHGILRLLYQFGDDPRLPGELLDRARRTVLEFKYWPDEPGRDSMCTWTENHQILFAGAGLLAGQLFPDRRFVNSGETGREKCQVARRRIQRWLDLRFRTGFSEWLSNVYYDEDMVALLSLVDFSNDEEIRTRASMVLDLLLLDLAHHVFKGVFGSTHGRAYEFSKKWARNENTTDVAKLHFGVGCFGSPECMSAPCFALSKRYRPPAVLYAIACDLAKRESEIRQRMGIRIEEAERWGLGFRDLEDGMVWLSLEAYTHPALVGLTMRMFDAFDWWENAFFAPFRAGKKLIDLLRRTRTLRLFARLFEWDMTRNLRSEVNCVSYRTPDFMLSSALDWRPGFGGDQQHLWQATLGPDAVCFTTHPGPRSARSPGYWTGSACLPRVGQVNNVVIALYRIHRRPALYVANRKRFTHAWLPRDCFDEVVERDGWVFARKGEGYLALRSSNPVHWQDEPGEDQGRELIAAGSDQVWICEMGRRAVDGPFRQFAARIAAAPLSFGRRSVVYWSPSRGRIEFGWRGPLRHRSKIIPMREFPRYDSRYAKAPFPLKRIRVQCGSEWLQLDWAEAERLVSRLLGT